MQPPKLHIALQFLISLSFETSAQIHLMKIKGIVIIIFSTLFIIFIFQVYWNVCLISWNAKMKQ